MTIHEALNYRLIGRKFSKQEKELIEEIFDVINEWSKGK